MEISIDKNTGCLKKIVIFDREIEFLGWGIEIGDGIGFFAQERESGWRVKIINKKIEVGERRVETIWELKLPLAFLKIKTFDLFDQNEIIRSIIVKNIRNNYSWLRDIVIRTVIPWEENSFGILGERVIFHQDTNFYNDCEEDKISLQLNKVKIDFLWQNILNIPPSFTKYFYIRDQPKNNKYKFEYCKKRSWVIHARLHVDYPAAYIYRIWREPFVFFSRGVLGKYLINPLKLKERWRAGEFNKEGKSNLYGVWPIKMGEQIEAKIQISFRCHEK